MKKQNLLEFFTKIGYNWKKDETELKEICKFTKTRVDPSKTEFELTWGMEQTFLIKAIAEWINAKSFFEIGTGRGTACYAVSLLPQIEKIVTIDIVPFTAKQKTAINFKAVNVSNQDIYNLIPYSEKTKISFQLRDQGEIQGKYDFCFIDGNHNNPKVIKKDIKICEGLLADRGLIIFDDYDAHFAVKGVVDQYLVENPYLDSLLIEFRGFLFPDRPQEIDTGVVLIGKNIT